MLFRTKQYPKCMKKEKEHNFAVFIFAIFKNEIFSQFLFSQKCQKIAKSRKFRIAKISAFKVHVIIKLPTITLKLFLTTNLVFPIALVATTWETCPYKGLSLLPGAPLMLETELEKHMVKILLHRSEESPV